MTRLDALQAAEAYVAETNPTTPPTKPNGYPVDGWRPTPPADRLALVLKVARFLLGEEGDE